MPDASAASLKDIYASLEVRLKGVRGLIERELTSHGPIVCEMLSGVLPMRGKMFRPLLLLLSGQACGGAGPVHVKLAAMMEMVHQASMIHDDVLDEASVRHGRATAAAAMGNAAAVMIGDLLVSHALVLCASLGQPRLTQVLADAVAELCEGEAEQIAHRGNWQITTEQYLRVAELKTASLTWACCRLGADASDAGRREAAMLATYGRKIGTAFQIVDDVLDLTGREDGIGKSVGQDLAGGDLTLPVIHYLCGDVDRVRQVRAASGGTDQQRADLTEALRRAGSIEYAESVARDLVAEAIEAVSGSAILQAREELAGLAEYVLARGS